MATPAREGWVGGEVASEASDPAGDGLSGSYRGDGDDVTERIDGAVQRETCRWQVQAGQAQLAQVALMRSACS